MEDNKQPLTAMDFLIKHYKKIQCDHAGRPAHLREDIIPAMNEFTSSQTKPLLEEIEALQAKIIGLVFNNSGMEKEISKLKSDYKYVFNESLELTVKLQLSQKENDELKQVLTLSEKNYVGKNVKLKSELTSVKEKLTECSALLSSTIDANTAGQNKALEINNRLKDQNKELAEALDSLIEANKRIA